MNIWLPRSSATGDYARNVIVKEKNFRLRLSSKKKKQNGRLIIMNLMTDTSHICIGCGLCQEAANIKTSY